MSGPETIYQPPVGELPSWVRTEGDVMAWLTTQGAPVGSRWRTEGPLPNDGRIWLRVQDEPVLVGEAVAEQTVRA